MDFKKELLKEHSKAQAQKLTDYVGTNQARMKALIEVYLEGSYIISQRAAWPLSLCAEKHPDLIIPHLKKLLDFLSKQELHNSVKRNTIRLLQFIDIPKRNHGQVAKLCFDYLQSKQEPIAVRVFSMAVLSKIMKDEPDLRNELKMIIEDQMPYSSAAFISRGRKILKQINALEKSKIK
jgi:hypothetical protein